MDSQFIAYLTFTAILVLTPGSTTAVVVRNALSGGRSAGLAAAIGAAVGNTSHAAAAGLGLAVVFARLPWAMTGLSVAGAAFLAWLGARSLYNVFRYADGGLRIFEREGSEPSRRGGSFRQGVAVNLLNPAVVTFYLVVLPSFLTPDAPRWSFAALAAAHIAMAFLCHGAWAVALDQLRRTFQPPAARRILEAATGIALLLLAVRVLVR